MPLATALAAAVSLSAHGDGTCTPAVGPDLVPVELFTIVNWGNVNGVNGFTFGTTVCNLGDEPEPFQTTGPDHHPVIAMNLYRIDDGRFEQIGMSWVKHTFAASTQEACCSCTNPGSSQLLGVGCSDPYSALTNASQAGSNGVGGLGPRRDINPLTGAFGWPYTTQGQDGDAAYKRLQVHDADLDRGPDAVYLAEAHYVAGADAAAGNALNNMAWRQAQVVAVGGGFGLVFEGETTAGESAIAAWQTFDPEVGLAHIDVPGDGRFNLAWRTTDTGDGTWHYEYVLHNVNVHRAACSFGLPVNEAGIINIGFHDVDAHSGEDHGTADWEPVPDDLQLTWASTPFEKDPSANSLRWGTAYTFRFDASRPPEPTVATIKLFLPGSPAAVQVQTVAPRMILAGDVNGDEIVDVNDLVMLIAAWGPCPPGLCPADIDHDFDVDVDDLVALIINWTV